MMKDLHELENFDAFGKPESSSNISRLKRKYNFALPEDYLNLLSKYGAINVFGEYESITLFTIDEILSDQLHDISTSLGNVIPIGCDDGGQYYFYDLNGKSSNGKLSVAIIDPGSSGWEYVISLGASLTEVLEKISSNVCFEDEL